MSVKVSSWVWHGEECANLVGNELVLMLALADVSGDEGRCRFFDDETELTYAALATKVRVDRRTIERLIPRLRDRGLLTHSKGAKGRPNEFRIVVPWSKKSTDNLSGNGSDSPTTAPDSPTTATLFPDNSNTLSSLKRTDVVNVGATAKRGARIDADWKPSELLVQWAEAKAPSVDLVPETENFVDYWIAKPGTSAVKLDWDATWRTWIRRTHQRNVERGWRGAQIDDPETAWMRR